MLFCSVDSGVKTLSVFSFLNFFVLGSKMLMSRLGGLVFRTAYSLWIFLRGCPLLFILIVVFEGCCVASIFLKLLTQLLIILDHKTATYMRIYTSQYIYLQARTTFAPISKSEDSQCGRINIAKTIFRTVVLIC